MEMLVGAQALGLGLCRATIGNMPAQLSLAKCCRRLIPLRRKRGVGAGQQGDVWAGQKNTWGTMGHGVGRQDCGDHWHSCPGLGSGLMESRSRGAGQVGEADLGPPAGVPCREQRNSVATIRAIYSSCFWADHKETQLPRRRSGRKDGP